MALHVSYKPGKTQSEQAARYFQECVGMLLDTMMQGLEEHTYVVDGRTGPSLRLRTWSRSELQEVQLHALFDHIVALRSDVRSLEQGETQQDQVHRTVFSWLDAATGLEDIFVELTVVDPTRGEEERPDLSLGLIQGRSVMVSTDRLLFSWLEQDIFGLAIADHGSYLFEVQEDRALRIAS